MPQQQPRSDRLVCRATPLQASCAANTNERSFISKHARTTALKCLLSFIHQTDINPPSTPHTNTARFRF